ncbi:MAG: PAS domain-containing sensor histidine kinase [Chloroflexi bacterium]|nr:PAS domain-containing sensor histidine kinase [Chloroflexota bacterium]
MSLPAGKAMVDSAISTHYSLDARQIAAAWFEAIRPAMKQSAIAEEVETHLSLLTESLVALVEGDEAVDWEAARSIGSALSGLEVYTPLAFERTLAVLSHELLLQAPVEAAQRAVSTISGIAGGFFEAQESFVRQSVSGDIEAVLASFLEHLHQVEVPIAILSDTEKILDCNAPFSALLGVSRDAVRDKALMAWIVISRMVHLEQALQDLAAGKRQRVVCFGRLRQREPGKRIQCVFTTLGNVTHVSRVLLMSIVGAEDESSAAKGKPFSGHQTPELLSGIVNGLDKGVGVIGADGQILAINHSVEELLGIPAEEAVGRHICEVDKLLQRAFGYRIGANLILRDLADMARTYTWSVQQRWPQERELEISAAPLRDRQESIVARLYTFRDMTAERAAEQGKAEFLPIISHEMRTPLTSIKGYINLVLQEGAEELPAETLEYLTIVQQNAERLNQIVNDLLDITRLDIGTLTLYRTPVDMRAVVKAVLELLQPLAKQKGHRMTVQIPAQVPLVMADEQRAGQILINLVSNAIKYTPPGGQVRVSIRSTERHLKVSVADTGVGLSREEQRHLFTRFYRANNPYTQQERGVGLGLAVTQALVKLHGGTLKFTSTPGRGSIFTFMLPFKTAGV